MHVHVVRGTRTVLARTHAASSSRALHAKPSHRPPRVGQSRRAAGAGVKHGLRLGLQGRRWASGGPGRRPLAIHGGVLRNGGGVGSGLERTRREEEIIRR